MGFLAKLFGKKKKNDEASEEQQGTSAASAGVGDEKTEQEDSEKAE